MCYPVQAVRDLHSAGLKMWMGYYGLELVNGYEESLSQYLVLQVSVDCGELLMVDCC